MSQSSCQLKRRSVEFNIRENPDIDLTDPKMSNLDQDTINALFTALQQADTTADPLAKRNTAPAPASIFEKNVEYPYKTGINTRTSDGKKMY